MALINCPECKKEVSDKAPQCPHCGNPIATAMKTPKPSDKSGSPIFTTNEQTPKSRGWFAYLFGGRREFILCILVLLGMIGMVMKGCSTIQKGIKEINDVEKKLQR